MNKNSMIINKLIVSANNYMRDSSCKLYIFTIFLFIYLGLLSQTFAQPLADSDELGRIIPQSTAVGTPTSGKTVAMFYFLWMGHPGSGTAANYCDLGKIISDHPSVLNNFTDPYWGQATSGYYYWGEPIYNYYKGDDYWVHLKNIQLLTDAGVDILVLDATNGIDYGPEVNALMNAIDALIAQGKNPPKLMFYTNSSSGATMQNIYNDFYKTGAPYRHPNTWYYMSSKPLIIGITSESAGKDYASFFTYRESQWPNEAQKTNGWPWIEFQRPQRVYSNSSSQREIVNVSLSQHPNLNDAMGGSAFYGATGNWGRSYRNGSTGNPSVDLPYGYNIQEQWDYAISQNVPYVFALSSKEYHVAKTGNDNNSGEINSPFLTIQAAANLAHSGDIITVHEGVYRERINPLRGGSSNEKRIVYQAAEDNKVEIKGSEEINYWVKFTGTVWKATIPNSMFGKYNPYKDLINGDWFDNKGRNHHTGEVYLNGKSFWEMDLFEKVLKSEPIIDKWDTEGSIYTWFCESDTENTYIYANFHEYDPNKELVEINVRPTCFYPDSTNINFITVRKFQLSQAATQWAPPTAEQIGLIGTNWSKGWIIENNIIRNSKCSGITLGKYGDKYDNTSANSAEGYIETVKRALTNGWNKENIGSHILRNNTIFDCEQTGICGSMGGVFSVIENNNIYNIGTKQQFSGAEMGGIKIHASIDMLIKGNRIVNCGKGIWVDWMAQGTRITSNFCYNNIFQDLYAEVNHGPYLVDNNLFLSLCSVWDMSQGGAYVHNLMAGKLNLSPQSRITPYHQLHSTQIAGYDSISGGDNRFLNNIFLAGCQLNEKQRNPEFETRAHYGKEFFGLKTFNHSTFPILSKNNVYLKGAFRFENEINGLELSYDPMLSIDELKEGIILSFLVDKKLVKMKNEVVTSKLLGNTIISKQAFVNPDNSSIIIDKDFAGNTRSKQNPTAGPFELTGYGIKKIKVW